MDGPFNHHQLKFVERFAEALFHGFREMAIPIEAVVANFQKQFELIGGTATENMAKNLDRLRIYLNLFHGFNKLPIPERRRFVAERFQHARNDIAQDAARLRAVVYGAYYGHWLGPDASDNRAGQQANRDNPVHRQIGFTLPLHRDPRPDPEPPIAPVAGRDIPPACIVAADAVPGEVDVIVVGSGSGGAVSACNLAERGYTVLVIEAGPFVPSSAITHEERRMGATLYKHGTLQMTADNDIVVFQGRNVGGSPTVNNGICLKLPPDAYDRWRDAGASIDRAAFERSFQQVADRLGLDAASGFNGRGNGAHLERGWNAVKAPGSGPADWFLKNYGKRDAPERCSACGYCNTGCPYARKLGMAQSYLPWACATGRATILPDTKVEEILWQPRNGRGGKRRAIGVRAVVGERQVRHAIAARVGVVVAAGTIASSKLLKASDIDGTGKGISLNIASPVVALMPAATTAQANWNPAWDEDQMTTAVDCGEFLLESHFQPPQSMAMLMPGWFEEMDRRMRAYGRQRSAGILFPTDRSGELHGGKLEVKLSHAEKDVMRRALATLTRVHFAAGAEEVWPALRTAAYLTRQDHWTGNRASDDEAIRAFFASHVEEKDDVTLSSAHPHGGNPIHDDPEAGVVDADCRLHAAGNVLVADASVFPASIRVNAQFTTMAMAQYATGRGDPFAGVDRIP